MDEERLGQQHGDRHRYVLERIMNLRQKLEDLDFEELEFQHSVDRAAAKTEWNLMHVRFYLLLYSGVALVLVDVVVAVLIGPTLTTNLVTTSLMLFSTFIGLGFIVYSAASLRARQTAAAVSPSLFETQTMKRDIESRRYRLKREQDSLIGTDISSDR